MTTNENTAPRKPLTVGDLRHAMQGLSGDAPVREMGGAPLLSAFTDRASGLVLIIERAEPLARCRHCQQVLREDGEHLLPRSEACVTHEANDPEQGHSQEEA